MVKMENIFDTNTGLWSITLLNGNNVKTPLSDIELSPFTIGSCVYLCKSVMVDLSNSTA